MMPYQTILFITSEFWRSVLDPELGSLFWKEYKNIPFPHNLILSCTLYWPCVFCSLQLLRWCEPREIRHQQGCFPGPRSPQQGQARGQEQVRGAVSCHVIIVSWRATIINGQLVIDIKSRSSITEGQSWQFFFMNKKIK